jgi:hypothetical protein
MAQEAPMLFSKPASPSVTARYAPSLQLWLLVSTVLLSAGILATPLQAGTLTITSTPSGATIEIDGIAAGKTPYHQDFPGAYLQKPHSVFTRQLEHSMTAKMSLDGYESQEITLTEGPHMYYTANGKPHGNYWLLKSGHFEVPLKKVKTEAAPAAQKPAAYHHHD